MTHTPLTHRSNFLLGKIWPPSDLLFLEWFYCTLNPLYGAYKQFAKYYWQQKQISFTQNRSEVFSLGMLLDRGLSQKHPPPLSKIEMICYEKLLVQYQFDKITFLFKIIGIIQFQCAIKKTQKNDFFSWIIHSF